MTYKHRGAQVKLVEELRDEDVSLDNFLLVDLLDATQYVEQPLELALTRRHPDEVHLHRRDIYPVDARLLLVFSRDSNYDMNTCTVQ